MSSAILISDDLVSNKMISFDTSFYCHWHHLTKEHILFVFICVCTYIIICCKQASKSLSKYICLSVILRIMLVTFYTGTATLHQRYAPWVICLYGKRYHTFRQMTLQILSNMCALGKVFLCVQCFLVVLFHIAAFSPCQSISI